MCGCECCISSKIIHSSPLTWRDHHLKNLIYRSYNAQSKKSGEISIHIFETYNNTVRPNRYYVYNSAEDMATEKMCRCTSKHNGIPKWKGVLRCYAK